MAGITKHPNSPFWTAIFYDGAGAKVRRSTKQRDRRIALKTAMAWEDTANAGREKRLTEAQARKVVGEILARSTGESLHFHSCRAWLDEWLAGKRGTTSPATLAKYEQTTRDFIAHLGERADLTLAAISPKDVRSFRDALAKGGRAPSTVNMAINKTLSAPFLAALRLGYVPTNPCAAVEALRDDAETARDIFTTEQVGDLVVAAEGDWKGAILCGYFTGLRLRDVAEMTWSAVDFSAGVIKVKTRKTRTTLSLPFGEELDSWLRAQPRGIGKAPIFPNLAGKGTGGRHGLSGRFKSIMEKAGIKGRTLRGGDRGKAGKGRTTSSLSFHSLRHTFVSALANAGVAAELRQKLSGHADERSHATYTHHELETLRGAVAKLPRLKAKG
jgi:integrase